VGCSSTINTHELMPLMVLGWCVRGLVAYPHKETWHWHISIYIFFFVTHIYSSWWGFGNRWYTWFDGVDGTGEMCGGNTYVPQQCSVVLIYIYTFCIFFATHTYSRWWGFENHLHTWFDAFDGAGEILRTNGILRQLSVTLIHVYTYFLVFVAYLYIFKVRRV